MHVWPGRREAVACDLCGRDDAAPLLNKNSFRIVRCRGCGLVYVSPRLVDLGSIYERASYQHHQADRLEHDEHLRPLAIERLAILDRFAPRKGRLLDVGCSRGWFVEAATEAGWKATGLDLSRPAVESIKSRGLDAVAGTIESAPLARHSFDAIMMFDSIEHMPSPMRALAAARELLVDDGVLFVTTPNEAGLLPRVTWRLFGRPFGQWDHPGPPGHIYQFSQETLRRALEDSGFDVVHDVTEAMDLRFSTEALEDVIVETLKHRGRRPDGDGGEVAEGGGGNGESRGPHPDGRVRFARRALRGVAHVAARAMVGTLSRGGALVGRGDSLITLARRR